MKLYSGAILSTIFLILVSSTASVVEDLDDIQNVRELARGNQDIMIYNGNWGGWKGWTTASDQGSYACGAEIRFEDSQSIGDDTAANGLKLKFCGLSNWNSQEVKTVENGLWGGWKGMIMCPYGKYIGGARVRYEDRQGAGDDTAINGLELWCVKEDWTVGVRKTVYPGNWGSWKSWGYRRGKLVKGARVRFESSQGLGDDTAMNGIHFNVEPPPNSSVSRTSITSKEVTSTTTDVLRSSSDWIKCTDKKFCWSPRETCSIDTTDNTGKCSCKAGYEDNANHCADDYDECKNLDPCHTGSAGWCVDRAPLDGQYQCFCGDGYVGLDDEGHGPTRCIKEDSCHFNESVCDDNADCDLSADDGQYYCNCNTGYVGDGLSCTLEPLSQSPSQSPTLGPSSIRANPKTCNDCDPIREKCSPDLSHCICKAGFLAPSGLGGRCSYDINECEDPKRNDCGANAECVNLEGSYLCSCNSESCAGTTVTERVVAALYDREVMDTEAVKAFEDTMENFIQETYEGRLTGVVVTLIDQYSTDAGARNLRDRRSLQPLSLTVTYDVDYNVRAGYTINDAAISVFEQPDVNPSLYEGEGFIFGTLPAQVTAAPTNTPTRAPVKAPTRAPTRAPTNSPVLTPTKSPVTAPVVAPTNSPVAAPVVTPTNSPVSAPVVAPTNSPVDAPVAPPTQDNPTDFFSPANSPAVSPFDSPVGAPN